MISVKCNKMRYNLYRKVIDFCILTSYDNCLEEFPDKSFLMVLTLGLFWRMLPTNKVLFLSSQYPFHIPSARFPLQCWKAVLKEAASLSWSWILIGKASSFSSLHVMLAIGLFCRGRVYVYDDQIEEVHLWFLVYWEFSLIWVLAKFLFLFPLISCNFSLA